MFHLATTTPAEVEVLRSIEQVIRLGRVRAIEAGRLVLDHGRVALPADALYTDCTASVVEVRENEVQPIFQGDKIVLQLVRLPQPAFSAALVAYVEAHYDGDAQKNRLCGMVPFPHTMAGYARSVLVNMGNQFYWGQDKGLSQWIRASRLDGFGKLMSGIDPQDTEKQDIMARFREQAAAAMGNLPKLIAAETGQWGGHRLEGSAALSMARPHPQNSNGLLLGKYPIDQTVANIDAPCTGSSKVPNQLLKGRWALKGILFQCREKLLRLGFQACRFELLGVFERLLRVHERPTHQRSSFALADCGSAMASRIDLRMPGTDNKYIVS